MKTGIIAKAIVLSTDGKLLALKRSETDDRRPLQWDIPGGRAEEGEDFAEATARETLEESGLKLDPKHLDLIYTKRAIKDTPQGPLSIIWLFFVGKTSDTKIELSYEHVEAKWMTLEEAHEDFEYPLHREVFKHLLDNDILDDLPL